jgi:5-(carboxyamino)imidazole ribonucleotide synthase
MISVPSSQDHYRLPVARIGIIGGGQLGRMLVKAAKRLGCTCVVVDPTPGSPAGQVSGQQIVADSHDPTALLALAQQVDVITFDIEDIDVDILSKIAAQGHRILPRCALLAEIQDKLRQKERLTALGIPNAPFVAAEQVDEAVLEAFGYPLVQKARRGGYDGRGVAVMHAAADRAQMLPVPSLLERFVAAEKELAVIVVRGQDGEVRSYAPVEMCFRPGQNILDLLLAPARVAAGVAEAARALATRTVTALDGVGIFGVEMFLTAAGELLVNEVAPRTHNSGHYTIEACITDQFEQHLRAITGLPLGATDQLMPAAMINLLGEPGESGVPVLKGLRAALAIPGVSVHLYGKAETRPFRKMGHVTILDPEIERAREKAEQVRALLTVGGSQT